MQLPRQTVLFQHQALFFVTEGQIPWMTKADLQAGQWGLTSRHLSSALMKIFDFAPIQVIASLFLCICFTAAIVYLLETTAHPNYLCGQCFSPDAWGHPSHHKKTGSTGSRIPTNSMLPLGPDTDQGFLYRGSICRQVVKQAVFSP